MFKKNIFLALSLGLIVINSYGMKRARDENNNNNLLSPKKQKTEIEFRESIIDFIKKLPTEIQYLVAKEYFDKTLLPEKEKEIKDFDNKFWANDIENLFAEEFFNQLLKRKDFNNRKALIESLNAFNAASKKTNEIVGAYLDRKFPNLNNKNFSKEKNFSIKFTQLKKDRLAEVFRDQTNKFISDFKKALVDKTRRGGPISPQNLAILKKDLEEGADPDVVWAWPITNFEDENSMFVAKKINDQALIELLKSFGAKDGE